MAHSENAILQELIGELDAICVQISNDNPNRNFQQASKDLTRWKARASASVKSGFSPFTAQELTNAGDFHVVSPGDFKTLGEEAERHRRFLSELAERIPLAPTQPLPEALSMPRSPQPSAGQDSNAQHDRNNHEGKNEVTANAGLLVKLGRIAGIGGIGVGTFLLLLGKLAFPALAAEQATLFMLLSYGVAIAGLIIWAAHTTSRRYLPILLAIFSFGLACIGLFAIRPAGPLGYNVRVTALSPSQTPVNNAHVWSTLGGEPKKVEGGWELAIPPTAMNREVTVYAEVREQGWTGNARVSLAGEHSPTVSIQLTNGGESPVRGIVLDKRGNAVSNAQVSVVGYSKEAVSTDANGGFELGTHTHEGDTVQLHAEKVPYVAVNYPDFKVGSGPAVLVLKDADEIKRIVVHQTPPPPPKIQQTGDEVIDRVLANLAALKQLQRPATEAQIASTLAPLFSRPAFYGIREEDWRYFLYPLCRTRLLLEEYVEIDWFTRSFESSSHKTALPDAILKEVIKAECK